MATLHPVDALYSDKSCEAEDSDEESSEDEDRDEVASGNWALLVAADNYTQ
jgi:hypothetical protein